MSGYRPLLHGTEAVVPLPDGRSIPVEMTQPQNITIPVTLQMGAEKLAEFVVKIADGVATVRQEQGVIGRAFI